MCSSKKSLRNTLTVDPKPEQWCPGPGKFHFVCLNNKRTFSEHGAANAKSFASASNNFAYKRLSGAVFDIWYCPEPDEFAYAQVRCSRSIRQQGTTSCRHLGIRLRRVRHFVARNCAKNPDSPAVCGGTLGCTPCTVTVYTRKRNRWDDCLWINVWTLPFFIMYSTVHYSLRWVCRRDRQTYRRTDARPLHYA